MAKRPHESLTELDAWIFQQMHYPGAGSFNKEAYEYGISDRNDYAVMLARTVIAQVGCRATRSRVMPS